MLAAAIVGVSVPTAHARMAAGQQPLPLRTGLVDAPPDAPQLRETGVTMLRIPIYWGAVAPSGSVEPTGFDPSNPADPAYNWADTDAMIEATVAQGLQPIIDVESAPLWAQTGTPQPYYGAIQPDPQQLAQFATAAAQRYSGSFNGLPRVRYWVLWNEPNLVYYLQPQYANGQPFSPGWYRQMTNAFADAVHAVHSDNLVVAGETAPFTTSNGTGRDASSMAPLAFMRSYFCLGKNLKPTCSSTVHIDAWSHHPYTSGGPTHHAALPDDVSLGDLPKMKAVLDAAWKYHRIQASKPPQFWVTEFSWDTDPPDPQAVPIHLQARWVAEALHVMWQNGISVVIWYSLFDDPMASSRYQSGLFFAPDASGKAEAKPALTAFRFPFVAYGKSGWLSVWGRTPTSHAGTVFVEQRSGARWVRVGQLRAAADGIFIGDLASHGRGLVRARTGSETSLTFSLSVPPDHFYNPFGTN